MSDEPAPPHDFRVEVLAYNNHILTAMILKGFSYRKTRQPSITQLVEHMRLDAPTQEKLRALIGLRILPTDAHGDWTPLATQLAATLEKTLDQLFPGKLRTELPAQHSASILTHIGTPLTFTVM